MSSPAPVMESRSATSENNLREWPRLACVLEAACQPIAARGDRDMSWVGRIRDISPGGLGLILKRRFERGVGLAIEIQETPDSPPDTLLAKVVHTTALGDGMWLLGCAFVSQLSDDEVTRLCGLGEQGRGDKETVVDDVPADMPVARARVPTPMPEVTWRAQIDGSPWRKRFRRFIFTGNWPLEPGRILKVWLGQLPGVKSRVRVEKTAFEQGRWFVDVTLLDTDADIHAFGHHVH